MVLYRQNNSPWPNSMLRIGKLTDYALLIMGHMAKEPDSVLSATSLADALYLTTPTVSKILKILSDAELLSSVRGAEGGYHLAKAAAHITLADIIAAMEGELALTECCENSLCALDPGCTMRENWRKINKIIHALLTKITILDMLEPLTLGSLFTAFPQPFRGDACPINS